jgi:CheY-like chemotaxis protein
MELAEALEEKGWDIIEASSGESALLFLAEKVHVDLIVTDIRLPGALSGWDVAEAYRAADSDVAVVYCSGNAPDLSRQVSGSVFLSKPCHTDELLDAGQRLCPR